MQARRSIKGDKDKQANASIAPKAAVAIVPPKKVSHHLFLQATRELRR